MAESNNTNSETKPEYKYEQVAGAEEDVKVSYNAKTDHVNVEVDNTMSIPSALPDRKFLYIAACAANLAAFTCGQGFGWTSPEIPKLKALDDNPLGEIITKAQEGSIGSYLPLGAALGPFAAGIAADRIGRKKTLLAAIIPFILSFIMCIMANDVNYFLIARFISGLSVGAVFTVLPMYVAEIADDEVRGSLGSFMQLFIVLGLLFSYVLGPYMSFYMFNVLCLVVPCVFVVVFFMFIPESPYYLVKAEDVNGAEEALMKIRGRSKDDVQKEIEEIKGTVEEAVNNKATFMDIFKSKGLTKALILSVGLVSLQQFSGINVVLFFAQDIFTNAGSTLAPEICTIIIGVVQVIASGCTPALVEKKGKRFLLLISAVGMAVSQMALGYFFYLKDGGKDISGITWLPIASLVFYIITYCLGFGPLPWAVMGELFPGNIKSAAATVTASGCWVLGFLITKYFQLIADIIGTAMSFGFFGVCCLGAALFVYKCVPETSGKSLQEIQDILSGTTENTTKE